MAKSPSFKQQLLDSEPVNPVLRDRYQKEIEAMFEQKLRFFMMAVQIFGLILGVFFVIIFSYATIISPPELPWLVRSMFILGVIAGIACIAFSVINLKKGSINQKTYPTMMTGMIWIVVVFMVTASMLLSSQFSEPVRGVQMVLNNLVFLVMGAVFMLQINIKQSGLKTQILLRIEHQLAELNEKLGK